MIDEVRYIWTSGSRYDFFLTTQELIEALTYTFNQGKAVCILYEYIRNVGKVVDISCDLNELQNWVDTKDRWQVWIADELMTNTELSLSEIHANINGFIGVQFPRQKTRGLSSSAIHVNSELTDGVENIEFKESLKRYRRLKRRIQKVLTHTSMSKLASGERYEDDLTRMSEGVIKEIQSGVVYEAEVGKPLNKRPS